jgi:PleD family two-component response regulator
MSNLFLLYMCALYNFDCLLILLREIDHTILLPTEILKQGKMAFEKGASSLKSEKIIETGNGDGTNNLATEKKYYVLVVDDDTVIRKIHSMILSKFPVEIQVAKNGKEAVDLFRSGAFFDLVLMDFEMPIMNGFEVCVTK